MKNILFIILAAFIIIGCAGREKIVEDVIFYPPLPQKPRIQYLTSFSTETDLKGNKSEFMDFLVGTVPALKRILKPYDVGASKGKIYISDLQQNKLLILDLKNKSMDYLQGKREGTYKTPAGIWITKDDFKYITDFKRKQVLVYDSNNNFVRSYGKKDQFGKPLDVVVYDDMVLVSDFEKHKVFMLDKETGELVKTIGELGHGEGEFYKPSSLAVDPDGNIYVNDSFNYRVQKFDSDGKFLRVIGYHGDTIGAFARPKGIAMDAEDRLYAVDTAFENAQIFDATSGELYLFFGGFTEKPGGMYLPNGISIDYENLDYFKKYTDKEFRLEYLIYVCNMLGPRKLSVYGYGEWIGEVFPSMQEN